MNVIAAQVSSRQFIRGAAGILSAFLLVGCGRGSQQESPPQNTAKTQVPGSEQKSNPQPAPRKQVPLDLQAIGVGAVVDLSQTPTGALFEAKVLGSRKLTWVERSRVDQVLRELQLQALFSPEGGGNRAGLGKLLKADLLVLLRAGVNPEDKKTKHLEIVVCQGQRGLRLAAQAVPLSGNAAAEVEQLETVLDLALAKISEKVTDICAVPPFINNDLNYKYDYLKSAFARTLEQHLLQRKGILVVELAEARALAKETLLSGQETNVERRMPLYFLGAFRNDGQGDQHRLQVTLKLQRGDKEIGARDAAGIVPSEAPKALAKLADGLADNAQVVGVATAFDPRAEIVQLRDRAAAHRQLANWQESLDLLEAALLLDTTESELHRQAAHACFVLVKQKSERARKQPELAMPMLHLYRRALEHTDLGVRPTSKSKPPKKPNMGPFASPAPSDEFYFAFSDIVNLARFGVVTKEQLPMLAEIVREHQAIMTQLCRLRAQAGLGDEHRFLGAAIQHMTDQKRYALVRSLIQELKDLPDAKERTFYFAKAAGQENDDFNDPGFRAFLEELAVDPHPEVRAGAQVLQKEREAVSAAAKQKADSAKAKPMETSAAGLFEPVPLTYGVSKKTGKPAAMILNGCIPLDGNVDCLVANTALFLMRQRDVAKRVWAADELNAYSSHFCYDGRYVWFSVARTLKTPRLFVLDPETEKVHEIGESDGLPVVPPESAPSNRKVQVIAVAPLSPGRVCAAGYFGKSWIGIVTFTPNEGKTVKLIHEARELAQPDTPMQWYRTTLVFRPLRMFTLTGPQGAARVLIGREDMQDGSLPQVRLYPLLADPVASSIEVMKDPLSRVDEGQALDGAFYYTGPDNQLVKLTYPGNVKSVLMNGVPYGRVVLAGDDLHVLTKGEWWQGSLSKKQINKVGQLPNGELRFMGQSNQYGILVNLWDGLQHKTYRLVSKKSNG